MGRDVSVKKAIAEIDILINEKDYDALRKVVQKSAAALAKAGEPFKLRLPEDMKVRRVADG